MERPHSFVLSSTFLLSLLQVIRCYLGYIQCDILLSNHYTNRKVLLERFQTVNVCSVFLYSSQVKWNAEMWVIRSVRKSKYYQIVLCTCSVAGSNRIKEACNNTIQCIVDESAMCLEPETIVPIHWSKQLEQVVLIGDHMQLQPIVKNRVAKSLGLTKSLFERYSYCSFMLEEQYRMVRPYSRISERCIRL